MNLSSSSAFRAPFSFYHRYARPFTAILIVIAAIAASILLVLYYNPPDVFAYEQSYWEHLFTTRLLDASPTIALLSVLVLGAIIGLVVHAAFAGASKWRWVHAITGEHNEIVGHFLGLVGVIYAVVLAFVVATAWQSYDSARQVAAQEQHDAVLLFTIIGGHHDLARVHSIKKSLLSYSQNLDYEWQAMGKDEHLCVLTQTNCDLKSRQTNDDVRNLGRAIVALGGYREKPSEEDQDAVIYQKSLDLFGSFTAARSQRRRHYDDRLLGTLWVSFFLGAAIVIIVSYLVGGQDPRSQRVRTMSLGAMVGIMIGLVLIFDHPYTGKSGISYSDENWCVTERYFSGSPKTGDPWSRKYCSELIPAH